MPAGPLLWFWYNHHFEGDWLDFMRGPYSAQAIERRTAPPGQHYREWHHPLRALVFYTRCAQIDASAWETGFGLMAASLYGIWLMWHRRAETEPRTRGRVVCSAIVGAACRFYLYSVGYGSVPIFIPQLYPHSYYNARYGMEMLPALSVFGALAAERFELWQNTERTGWGKLGARFWQPFTLVLCVANCLSMTYFIPLVLKEGMVNSTTRVALERFARICARRPAAG